MKIGLNMMLWTTRVTEEHFHLFEKIKAVGYDGVEIPILGDNLDEAHHRKVAQALKDNGLQCSSSTALPGKDHDAISADPTKRANAVDFIKRVIDCSCVVGADVLIGPFYQPLGQFTGVGPTDAEKQFAVDSLKQMAGHAQARGIDMAVEYLNRFECYFLNTLADAAALVQAVDNPHFGAMLDTFHANIEEKDPVAAIEQHGSVLKHFHVSDNDRGTPGKGHVSFDGIFQALKSCGYDGWYTIEAFGLALPELAAAARIWRPFFSSPEEVLEDGFGLIKSIAYKGSST